MKKNENGFEELSHTADWAMRVWAESLPALFAEAARGMNALTGAQQAPGARTKRVFTAKAEDLESLLVAFLSELVWAIEQEKILFDSFDVKISQTELIVSMSGMPLLALSKSIKAVTYHNLHINKNEEGYQVEIVFDV